MRPTTPLLAQLDVAAILITSRREELHDLWQRCPKETKDIVDVLAHLVFGPPKGDPRSECDIALSRLHAHRRQVGDKALRQAVISAFIADDLTKRKVKTEINNNRPVLGDFFTFDTHHCEINRCYPEVVLKHMNDSTGQAQNQSRYSADYLPRQLYEYLENDAQVATYTVTPAKAEQGLALLERQALAFSAQDANLGFWSASGLSAVDAAALEREPLILSIGDWGKLSSTNSKEKVTKFAWIVLPRREASRLGRAAQRPDHVSISAVVSVPSWWKSIQLDIATCWLPPDSLEMIEPEDLCETEGPADPKQYTLKVAVPGDASEVMNKLRFEVITFPYVFRQQATQVLEVGRPGTLTILGGRLWRSPTVVMGTEAANRIEVLPDMRGIVAHFECIHPYPGTPGTSDSAASRAGPDGLDQSDTRSPTR